jgi:hypothetical protein
MDLWTYDDQSDHIPVSIGTGENGPSSALRSTRRLTERAILSLFRTWLLQEFVPSYGHSLGATRIFRRFYWIDGLGSFDVRQGRRMSLHVSAPPVLQPIIELSQKLLQDNPPITLYGLLLSAGSSKRQPDLSDLSKIFQRSSLITTSWLEAATAILDEIEQSPAIFLLNPLGSVMFGYDDMLRLYQRTVPTEIFLLLSHKHIETSLQTAAKVTAQANALTALLRSDRWKSLPATGNEAITGFSSLLIASMQRHFQWPPQRIEFPIYNGPARITQAPYTLIYATRRQESFHIMNDAYCGYQRRITLQSYRGVLGEEWFVQREQERQENELHALMQQIYQQGRTLRTRRWPDLRQQLMLSNFGEYTLQEYNRGLRQLIEQEEVTCIWHRAEKPDERNVPGNEDTLRWH